MPRLRLLADRVYRSRTTPERSANLAFFSHAPLTARRLGNLGDQTALFTHMAVPVMTRLRLPERELLDTLVRSGVARSRSHALAWCVRLVAKNESAWIAELKEALSKVGDVRSQGPLN
jgi:hypothetical protein